MSIAVPIHVSVKARISALFDRIKSLIETVLFLTDLQLIENKDSLLELLFGVFGMLARFNKFELDFCVPGVVILGVIIDEIEMLLTRC